MVARRSGWRCGHSQLSPHPAGTALLWPTPPGEVVTGSHAEDYDISTKDNVYVGWFGIVRHIDEDQTGHRTVLTVEHKYFDGLTDAHQQTVSFNGAGDFRATLAGTDHRIPPLSLVRIYGTVTKSQDSDAEGVSTPLLIELLGSGDSHRPEEWHRSCGRY